MLKYITQPNLLLAKQLVVEAAAVALNVCYKATYWCPLFNNILYISDIVGDLSSNIKLFELMTIPLYTPGRSRLTVYVGRPLAHGVQFDRVLPSIYFKGVYSCL